MNFPDIESSANHLFNFKLFVKLYGAISENETKFEDWDVSFFKTCIVLRNEANETSTKVFIEDSILTVDVTSRSEERTRSQNIDLLQGIAAAWRNELGERIAKASPEADAFLEHLIELGHPCFNLPHFHDTYDPFEDDDREWKIGGWKSIT